MSEPTESDDQLLLPNLAMSIPEILKELEYFGGRFPRAAMLAAVEQREAITPELLRVLEMVAEDRVAYANRIEYSLHLFALFLLAQFRERRAYPLIVKMVGAPGETADDLIGDTITGGLSRILGSVYDGNPAPLTGLVENAQVNEFVRSAALEAFIVLERSGQMRREEVLGYLRKLFQGGLEREPSFAWDALVHAVGDLPAPELIEEVRRAYAQDLADPSVASLEDIESDLVAPRPGWREKLDLITDAIKETEWWATFDPNEPGPGEFFEPEPPPLILPPAEYGPPEPFLREQPKIGRNEPCPCGSGKKYKKCCGKS